MNIVLQGNGKGAEFYIACIRQVAATYHVLGKCITSKGELRECSKNGIYASMSEAVQRCRALAKTKVRKKDMRELSLPDIPKKVAKHLEVPPDMKVSPEELLEHIRRTRTERYVVFREVVGIEEWFDAGVEYLAHVTDDEGVLLVYDRFGDQRECFVERMESVVPTEDAKKAEGIKKL